MPSDTTILPNEDPLAIQELYDAFTAFDISASCTVVKLADLLDAKSILLAGNRDYRLRLGDNPAPSLWPILHQLWNRMANAISAVPLDTEARLAALCLKLAKFTRNLVAAAANNQYRAFENEPMMRTLLFHYTSFTVMQRVNSFTITAMLAQAISNLVTANELLTQKLWATYMSLPEEHSILIRLLALPDPRTALTAFVFVLNCVHGSPSRIELLIRSAAGHRLCVTLLDRILTFFDAEDGSDEAHAFDTGYRIFYHVFEGRMVSMIYTRLAVEDEVIVPHQITLLKLLDAYLQNQDNSASRGRSGAERDGLVQMLTSSFLTFSNYVQHAIQNAFAQKTGDPTGRTPNDVAITQGPEAVNTPRELDFSLPTVCEALVLVTQCLISLTLAEVGDVTNDAAVSATHISTPSPMLYINETSSAGQDVVEALLETLRLLDAFLPRVTFGKVVQRPLAHAEDIRDMDANGDDKSPQPAPAYFSYLKRDLVRLLGILCADNRAVQDRVRTSGGIPVVMNLCVVDDQNPFLREHAIFTLRNLLYGNKDNQDVVDEIRPIGKWDEDGVLRGINARGPG